MENTSTKCLELSSIEVKYIQNEEEIKINDCCKEYFPYSTSIFGRCCKNEAHERLL